MGRTRKVSEVERPIHEPALQLGQEHQAVKTPYRRRRKLGAMIVAASVLSACGLEDLRGEQVVVTTSRSEEVPADPRVQEMLADGEVTAAEMERAFQAYVECMAEAGMAGRYAYDVERLGHSWTMEYNMPGDGPEGRLTDEIEGRCYSRFERPLEGQFVDPLSNEERVARRRQSTIDCMAEIDPNYATIPPDVAVDPGSDIQRRAVMSGDVQIDECIATGGIGWTDLGTPDLSDDSVQTTEERAEPADASTVTETDMLHAREYPMDTQIPPDPRDYIPNYVVLVDVPGYAFFAKVGERIDHPGHLGAAFSCSQQDGEGRVMVVVDIESTAPEVVGEAINQYAEAAGCEPDSSGPPVKCMDLPRDPVSCDEVTPSP